MPESWKRRVHMVEASRKCQRESKPPLIRKVLQFAAIMCPKEQGDDSGRHALVSRAVTCHESQSIFGVIIIGVNVIPRCMTTSVYLTTDSLRVE